MFTANLRPERRTSNCGEWFDLFEFGGVWLLLWRNRRRGWFEGLAACSKSWSGRSLQFICRGKNWEGGGGLRLGWLKSDTVKRDVTMAGFSPGEFRSSASLHRYSNQPQSVCIPSIHSSLTYLKFSYSVFIAILRSTLVCNQVHITSSSAAKSWCRIEIFTTSALENVHCAVAMHSGTVPSHEPYNADRPWSMALLKINLFEAVITFLVIVIAWYKTISLPHIARISISLCFESQVYRRNTWATTVRLAAESQYYWKCTLLHLSCTYSNFIACQASVFSLLWGSS